ncbi:F0F1 ATP synthase subunit A [Pseudogulbenkiania sp. NH8B]|uniref:F0F1 ATP synthase subunit A n=1 Tax=Pseudogulbenkiania sp. (strain NH8B) TaxID=748280 RepID=UPI00022798EF|nr:F0F1 ATP synthase subunit A [Pseudogulbenkiania sp. NH8B]BAK77281.1 F0F1 ATP synthase subunit A [Pseudogulbenkiania sp. NH8B]
MNGLSGNVWLTVAGIGLSEPLILSAALTVLFAVLAYALGRRLSGRPERLQVAAEAVLVLMTEAVAEVVPAPAVPRVLPFIATLWLFILAANLLGLVPGLSAPTRDLSVTAALAVLVFLAVHVYGIRAAGWRRYLRHYLQPSPILLPFHLVSELTRTLALAVRLFGNMMSLEMAALLVLLVAGFLVPVPLLLLHVIEALVQAYIFGMLALIYIGGALEAAPPPAPPSPTESAA